MQFVWKGTFLQGLDFAFFGENISIIIVYSVIKKFVGWDRPIIVRRHQSALEFFGIRLSFHKNRRVIILLKVRFLRFMYHRIKFDMVKNTL